MSLLLTAVKPLLPRMNEEQIKIPPMQKYVYRNAFSTEVFEKQNWFLEGAEAALQTSRAGWWAHMLSVIQHITVSRRPRKDPK